MSHRRAGPPGRRFSWLQIRRLRALAGRPAARPPGAIRALPLLTCIAAAALPGGWTPRVSAGVIFRNCVTGSDGSITCDTAPTGNAAMQDLDARYGLLNDASPGWSEFDPYGGYGDAFGDDED